MPDMANPQLVAALLRKMLSGGDEGIARKALPPREGVGSTGPGPKDFEGQLGDEGIFIPEGEPRQFQSGPTPDPFIDAPRKFENKATTTPRLQSEKAAKAKKVPEQKTLDQLDIEGKQSREGIDRIERQLVSEGLGNSQKAVENRINAYVQDTFTAWNDVFPEFKNKATRQNPGLGTADKRLKDGFKKLSAAADTARNPNATDEIRKAAIKEVIAIREWLTK
jgi:hypothetical protein